MKEKIENIVIGVIMVHVVLWSFFGLLAATVWFIFWDIIPLTPVLFRIWEVFVIIMSILFVVEMKIYKV